ncbi:MAG: non-canonical purine NTP pyrophosphatase, RdgB/HAM1 family [Planctomycetes bacterium GWF2_41_51]|nr:MAG: non-canonical purine NTP pyrophosphatase, RdgB/HAM1 family [Planctomycetes bacterium GWF2_41_51]HBG25477.1 non-canonical purine NTP pyrophosphatase [Phycisphaerales bacterium]
MKILVATTNPGKLKEISEMLDFDVEWKSLADFPDIKEVEEDGKTFAENARKKALGYAKQTGLWTLADDSGLVVDALGGLPGVNSARFSGQSRDSNGALSRGLLDHKNMAKLLSLLENISDEKRTARFICCLCIANPEKILIETSGALEGVIIRKEQGTNGFGYDPIFFVPNFKKTVAQLESAEKNKISHRGKAIHKLKPLLLDLINR